MDVKQSAPQVTDAALRLPGDFPELPTDALERFPSLGTWMQSVNRFFQQNANAIQDFAQSVLDVTEVAGVLIVDGGNGSLYIKSSRGAGSYNDPDTPFYVDRAGYFSLKNKLTWDPTTNVLTVDGTIYADAGNIGGFEIGADYIRDEADTMGLASTATGGDDVRFWAGDTFANRAAAPFRVTKGGALVATNATVAGDITATSGTIAGWVVSATTLSKNNAVLDSAGQLALGTGNDIIIISATDATYRLWVGNATAGTATFSVTKLGALFSTAGTIGGFSIGTDYLRDTANSMGLASTITGGDDVRFWAGNTFANRATAPFRVLESGAVTATNATITGDITATSGAIGGFAIGADYVRDTANSFGLASTVTGGDDVRFWAGDTFTNRATAPFRVYESGAIFSSSGTIGGFTISASELSSGAGIQKLSLSAGGLSLGSNTATRALVYSDTINSVVGFSIFNSANVLVADLFLDTSGGPGDEAGGLTLYDDAGTAQVQMSAGGLLGAVAADIFIGGFSGNGSSITSLNASNIASGTLNNARLPSAISVTSLTASGEIRGGTARFGTFTAIADTPVIGWMDVTDAGGTARRLAVV